MPSMRATEACARALLSAALVFEHARIELGPPTNECMTAHDVSPVAYGVPGLGSLKCSQQGLVRVVAVSAWCVVSRSSRVRVACSAVRSAARSCWLAEFR